jgi:hypothetical protein
LTSSACSDAVRALGATPERASQNTVTMLDALANRFGPVELSPEIARSRPLLARYSTTPSRIFGDRDMWTAMSDSTRVIEIGGQYQSGRYLLAHQPGVGTPDDPGEARHVMHLQRLGENEYRWRSVDEVALGPATASEFDRALTTLFHAAERIDGPTIRALTRASFPRATASIQRLVVMDSLRSTPHSDGSASVVIGIGVRPAIAERAFQSLGPYARKYWLPMRWRVRIQDSAGLAWGEFTKRDSTIVLQLRVRDGSLAPLDGQRVSLGSRTVSRGRARARHRCHSRDAAWLRRAHAAISQ